MKVFNNQTSCSEHGLKWYAHPNNTKWIEVWLNYKYFDEEEMRDGPKLGFDNEVHLTKGLLNDG